MASIQFEKHHPIDWFDVDGGELLVGGHTVSELAKRANGQAFYAYDRRIIDAKIDALRQHFPNSVKLHYAIKANSMPELVEWIAPRVDGLDVASGQELALACTTATPRHDISFAGPGKQEDELAAAVDSDIVINCESPTELERIDRIARERDVIPKVAIRVNPDFQLQNSGMKMAGGSQQFGIDAESVPVLLDQMGNYKVEFYGFHIFSGSQNLRADAIVESQQQAYELAVRLARFAPADVRMFNIGGGLGVPYFPGEEPVDLAPIGDNLAVLSERLQKDLPQAELVVELGRYFVAESGVYVCQITDRKISRGHVFLVCNGGLHHHLAASGNFGQVLRKNYPVAIATKLNAPPGEPASVVGPLCTPLDLLAAKMPLADADIGDLVAVFQSGAYGFTASPHLFLSHPPPHQFFV